MDEAKLKELCREYADLENRHTDLVAECREAQMVRDAVGEKIKHLVLDQAAPYTATVLARGLLIEVSSSTSDKGPYANVWARPGKVIQ